MKAKIKFHPAADAEVQAARQWYEARSPISARAFATEVGYCVRRVAESPDRWPADEFGMRRFLFRRFPFSLIYVLDNAEVEILAVAHHRRLPGDWRNR